MRIGMGQTDDSSSVDLSSGLAYDTLGGSVSLDTLNAMPLTGQVGQSTLDTSIANSPITTASAAASSPDSALYILLAVAGGLVFMGLVGHHGR